MLQKFVVPKSKYTIPVGFHAACSERIVRARFRVLTTVKLDDDVDFNACEVCDEAGDRVLAAEAVATQATIAEMAPEEAFAKGGCFAEASGVGPDRLH